MTLDLKLHNACPSITAGWWKVLANNTALLMSIYFCEFFPLGLRSAKVCIEVFCPLVYFFIYFGGVRKREKNVNFQGKTKGSTVW